MKSLQSLPGCFVIFDDYGNVHKEDQKKQPPHFQPSLQANFAALLPRKFTVAQAVKLFPQYAAERVRMTVYNMRKTGYIVTEEKHKKRTGHDLLVHHKTPKAIALEELYIQVKNEQTAAAGSSEN